MKVKKFTLVTAAGVFIFFFVGGAVFFVRADTHDTLACQELEGLKNRSADIGGFARNLYMGWIANRYTAQDGRGFGVAKKGFKEGVASGGEIIGSSKIVSRPDFGYLCWGETCADYGNVPLGDYPQDNDLLNPQVGSYYDRRWPFAELDFEHAERMCQDYDVNGELKYRINPQGKSEPVYFPCNDTTFISADDLKKKQGNADYCVYPVKGWARILGVPGTEGWTRLSTRMYGADIPIPQRNDDGTIREPGTFGEWEKWPKANCLNDADYANNKKACTRGVFYDARKKEFAGWAWNPTLKWISFSGSTLYDTREWANPYWCAGVACTTVHYNQSAGRSRWNTAYLGVWVKGIGGNIFSRTGFSGVNPPPGEFNSDYLIVTGRSAEAKQSRVDNWEGRCEGSRARVAAGCADVAERVNKKQKPRLSDPEPSPQDIFDIRPPSSSTRLNRSLIKRGALGFLNAAALLPKKDAAPLSIVVNDNGVKVKIIQDETQVFGQSRNDPIQLDSAVYYYEGDLVIGDENDRSKRIILNGIERSFNGAGTIVVRGNLIIRRPLEYASSQIKDLKKLASLSWIVLERKEPLQDEPTRPAGISNEAWSELVKSVKTDKDEEEHIRWNKGGNIVIDGCIPANTSEAIPPLGADAFDEAGGIQNPAPRDITEPVVQGFLQGLNFASLAGSFFAENTFVTGGGHGGPGDAECRNLKISYTVKTSEKDEDNKDVVTISPPRDLYYDVPIEIRGVIVAKDILFERAYRGVNRGSETIINDGRLLANPPPGIAEFARSLPLW